MTVVKVVTAAIVAMTKGRPRHVDIRATLETKIFLARCTYDVIATTTLKNRNVAIGTGFGRRCNGTLRQSVLFLFFGRE